MKDPTGREIERQEKEFYGMYEDLEREERREEAKGMFVRY